MRWRILSTFACVRSSVTTEGERHAFCCRISDEQVFAFSKIPRVCPWVQLLHYRQYSACRCAAPLSINWANMSLCGCCRLLGSHPVLLSPARPIAAGGETAVPTGQCGGAPSARRCAGEVVAWLVVERSGP